MARPLRLDHAGAVWHLTSRGNERREIFREDEDRERFLRILAGVVKRFRWRVHAYVLMGNHYHLLVDTPEPTLSRGMKHLNGVYTQSFNRRHRRVGHLLQGRFKAILVERESHLLELTRYVVLNPVRAGMTETAGQWKWSNYRATAGLRPAPAWLETEWTLEQFPPRREAERRYRAFVAREGISVRSVGGVGLADLPRQREPSEENPDDGFRPGEKPPHSTPSSAPRPAAARGDRRRDFKGIRSVGLGHSTETAYPGTTGRRVPGAS